MPTNQLTGISCRIIPNDDPSQSLPLPEYMPQSEFLVNTATRQETVYIESTLGGSFAIHLELDNPQVPQQPRTDLLIYISLDGVKVCLCRRSHTQSSTVWLSTVLSSDRRTMRNFQFAPIALVDADDETLDLAARAKLDGELCNDEEVIKNLGSIQINLVRCELGRNVPFVTRSSDNSFRTANQMKFSERCKKAALSNTAGLSDDALPNPKPEVVEQRIEWEELNPFLRFVFKYRSRALLEAEGIVLPPLLPVPAPLPGPPAMPHGASSQTSASNMKLKQDPGQPEKKPEPNFLEINSEDELEEKAKPKIGNQPQSIKGEDKKVTIKKRDRTITSSTSSETQSNHQILIVDDDDDDDIKEARKIRRKNAEVIDLTED